MDNVHGGNVHHIYADTELLSARLLIILSMVRYSQTFIFSLFSSLHKKLTSRSHYGSKVPAVTITVFKYRNKIGKIVVKAVPYSVT
jgi:hypothetical protein